MQRLMDLKYDYAFKQIFGKAGNEPILIAFLNAVLGLPEEKQITSVQILNPEFVRYRPDGKTVILDLLVRTEQGVFINVEMQLGNNYDMKNRTLTHWSMMYVDQFRKGALYKELSPAIAINLLNFDMIKDTDRYHTSFRLYEDFEKFPLTDMMRIHFLEIRKALEQWEAGHVDLKQDKLALWILVFHADKHEAIRTELEEMKMQDPAIKQLFEAWERLSQDDSLWYEYLAWQKAERDAESARAEAEERGEARGLERGDEKGRLKVAKSLLVSGMETGFVSEHTGFSIEELEELKKQLH